MLGFLISSFGYDYSLAEVHVSECRSHISGVGLLAPASLQSIDAAVNALVAEDLLGATIGKKSFILGRAKSLKLNGENYNKLIVDYNAGSDNTVDIALVKRELATLKQDISKSVGKVLIPSLHNKYLKCAMSEVAANKESAFSLRINAFINSSADKYNSSKIGYFEVVINSCQVKQRVGTGNIFAEPEAWEGSEFLVIDASFKNIDTEGRLPVVGDVLIFSSGKTYKYDTAETIMLDGYGVHLNSVNPLVKMKTKVVYRIPSGLKGEVYWMPGRNTNGVKLWCGYLD